MGRNLAQGWFGGVFLGDKIRRTARIAASLAGHEGFARAKQIGPVASGPRSVEAYTGAMSTCVVTGGAGFLGSHLCDELLARGNRVICVDNLETGSLANIEHIRDPGFRHLTIDIIEPYEIDEPVDFVYHLASPASPIDYLRLPLHTLKVGSYGTHHTLGLAKAKLAKALTNLGGGVSDNDLSIGLTRLDGPGQ